MQQIIINKLLPTEKIDDFDPENREFEKLCFSGHAVKNLVTGDESRLLSKTSKERRFGFRQRDSERRPL